MELVSNRYVVLRWARPGVYGTRSRVMRTARLSHSKKPPRPDCCDLAECSKHISADEPLFTDHVWPMMIPTERSDGIVTWRHHVPNFCSEDCRGVHRSRILARRTHSTRPSP